MNPSKDGCKRRIQTTIHMFLYPSLYIYSKETNQLAVRTIIFHLWHQALGAKIKLLIWPQVGISLMDIDFHLAPSRQQESM
jgi:hypothetical protein